MTIAAKSFRVTGRHVLVGVTLFFLLIVGFDVWFATLAYRSFPGEDAKDPYEAGIAYDKVLEKRAAQARLGWRVSDEKRNGGVILRVVDAAGAPVTGLAASIDLVRPATESGKRSVPLREVSPGAYEARGLALDGAWDVHATFRTGRGETFEAERRLQWP